MSVTAVVMFIDIINITILNIYGFDYHCIIVVKNEAINLSKNDDLSEISGSL